jgi:predicted dehydrogenase
MEEIALPVTYTSHPDIALDWQAEIQPSFPMALSMHAMVAAIHGRGNASPDFSRAFEIERLQEAIRVSSAERRWVKITDIV